MNDDTCPLCPEHPEMRGNPYCLLSYDYKGKTMLITFNGRVCPLCGLTWPVNCSLDNIIQDNKIKIDIVEEVLEHLITVCREVDQNLIYDKTSNPTVHEALVEAERYCEKYYGKTFEELNYGK